MLTLFRAYEKVNETFARTVTGTIRAGDMVWVHSFPLLLVPAALRQARARPRHSRRRTTTAPPPAPSQYQRMAKATHKPAR